MRFTALHHSLGLPPGPVTDEMIDTAVDARLAETTDLDWKSEVPAPKNLSGSDFPKDIAAMANSGGGVIVYGISEEQKAATGRGDIGELNENHERALRQVAISAISPPLFGLTIDCLGEQGRRVIVVEVPASIDGPHLILRNHFFGAPIRNDADTVWMQERQIEAMYRARFEECQWPVCFPRRRPGVLPTGGQLDLPNDGQIPPHRCQVRGQFNAFTPAPEVA